MHVHSQVDQVGPDQAFLQSVWVRNLSRDQWGLQEPILSLRRQLATLGAAEADAGACWLQLAKLCRVHHHHEAAMTASLEALARSAMGAAREHARLLWAVGQPHRAIAGLEQVRAALLTPYRHCVRRQASSVPFAGRHSIGAAMGAEPTRWSLMKQPQGMRRCPLV